jgi:hypothetical protein
MRTAWGLEEHPSRLGGFWFESQRPHIRVAEQLGMLARSGELACRQVLRLTQHSLHLPFHEGCANSGADCSENGDEQQALWWVDEHDPVVEETSVRGRPGPKETTAPGESSHTVEQGHDLDSLTEDVRRSTAQLAAVLETE